MKLVSEIKTQRSFEKRNEVSVIVPCYNVGLYLQRCMESIINQSCGLGFMQIICINDASTDNTFEILKNYEQRYDQLLIVNLEKNGGLSNARNVGISYAEGKYIVFVDSDDFIAPDMIEKLYSAMEYTGAYVASCDNICFADTVPWALATTENEIKIETIIVDDINDRGRIFFENSFATSAWAKMFRTDFIKNNDDLRFPYGSKAEDVYWTYMISAYTNAWVSVCKPLYYYFFNQNGISKSVNLKNYYMDGYYSFDMAMQKYKRLGLFVPFREEISYVYYKKILLTTINFIFANFSELPLDNVKLLLDYLKKEFPEIVTNRYMNEDERREAQELLDALKPI